MSTPSRTGVPSDGNERSSRDSEEPKRPVLLYIQGILPSLNPTERLIAEYALADPERIISSSIADVRDGSKASVGSIVGFCRSLGLRGFAEFKLTLARELAQGGFPGTTEGSSEQTGSLTQRVLDFHIRSLTETFQVNRDEKIEHVARMMEKARRIEFFSIGISYPIAYTARCKFRLIGLPASAESDSHLQVIAATQLRKNDVAFGISCSGSTRETVRCMEIAKAKGICLPDGIAA